MITRSAVVPRLLTRTRVRFAAAIVPLSVLSVSWTLGVAGAGVGPVSAGAPAPSAPAHSGEAPGQSVDVPATLSEQQGVVRPVRIASVAAAGSKLIPGPALAAYQRAATVMDAADEKCGLEWPLVAAIGKAESDHGAANGSTLRVDGVAVPAIVGVPLDGSPGRAAISDTDGGRLDRDRGWDRAVGPMQFIPTTWGVVGVDADGDGQRNPQDIDDAALAAAVYLCSGDEDLSTAAGQRTAVLRYDHSQSYADSVLAIARSYVAGAADPVGAGLAVSPAGQSVSGPRPVNMVRASRRAAKQSPRTRDAGPATRETPSSVISPGKSGAGAPAGGGGTGGDVDKPPPKPSAPLQPVVDLVTTSEAILACTLSGLSGLLEPVRFKACVADRTS